MVSQNPVVDRRFARHGDRAGKRDHDIRRRRYDQFGAPMATQPVVTFSKTSGIGSIDPGTGVYSSPSIAGSATIQAASGSISGTATVTINNGAPTVATAASASPSTVSGKTTALSVLGADDGGESNLTYSWAATSIPAGAPAPAFGVNSSNAAKNTVATLAPPAITHSP